MADTFEEETEKRGMIYPAGYKPQVPADARAAAARPDPAVRNQLLNSILQQKPSPGGAVPVDTDLFAVMAARRSTRKFADRPVEPEKVDRIIAAADTAPTAGNYQGFEIFLVRGPDTKRRLVAACNNQPYVDAPLVLVFCKNPARVKFDFPDYILRKFAIQDATLARGLLAARGPGPGAQLHLDRHA